MPRVEIKYPDAYPVFCVGGSAGAVTAFQQIVAGIPPEFPAPIFLVLHRQARPRTASKFALPEILRRHARLEVVCPVEAEVIRAGRIYVLPPGVHTVVEDNQVRFRNEPADCPWRPSIDVLFKSVARHYRSRAVCVLLSGMLHDGVEGLKETTREGGITVAQSPEDAYVADLPLNAILEDHPSYVLPLRDMARLFCELCHFKQFSDQDLILQEAAITAFFEKKELKGS